MPWDLFLQQLTPPKFVDPPKPPAPTKQAGAKDYHVQKWADPKSTQFKILQVVAAHPGICTGDVAIAVDRSPSQTSALLSAMCAGRVVTRTRLNAANGSYLIQWRVV